MIEYTKGDILQADAEAIVNTVNCVGVMGRGVALQFKKAYPENFRAYKAACDRGEVVPGRMFVYDTGQFSPRWVVNFPTKRHWRGKSRMGDVESGLLALVSEIADRKIRSVALPPLGSGLGGLEWSAVRTRIDEALSSLPDVHVTVFEPGPAPQRAASDSVTPLPTMTPGRAALVGLMQRYLAGMMDTSISLLEIHKLMYFLQVCGEPLKLRYVKAHYGPYAENLRHVLQAIDGHMISGFVADGDAPTSEFALMHGAIEAAESFLAEYPETEERFEKVTSLVNGFESSFGLELLATVHWVMAAEGAHTNGEITAAVYAWNAGKRQFKPDQIVLAAQTLRDGGWAEPSRRSSAGASE